jgi:hypothetical protein
LFVMMQLVSATVVFDVVEPPAPMLKYTAPPPYAPARAT